jgi:hypothetical protein
MAYHAMAVHPGDVEFPISAEAFNALRDFAFTRGKTMGWAARIFVNRFLMQAKYVKMNLSRLEFKKPEVTDMFFTTHLDTTDEDILALATAGRFYAHEILEVAISLVGLKAKV